MVKPVVKPVAKPAVKPVQTSENHNLVKILREKQIRVYAKSWCGWCQRQKKLLEEIFQGNCEIFHEDTDDVPVGIQGFPTWVLPEQYSHLFDGKHQLPGFHDLDRIKTLVNTLKDA